MAESCRILTGPLTLSSISTDPADGEGELLAGMFINVSSLLSNGRERAGRLRKQEKNNPQPLAWPKDFSQTQPPGCVGDRRPVRRGLANPPWWKDLIVQGECFAFIGGRSCIARW
ncbi:hypothetical protein chiPu_0013474 [Chiloscyllium punctatum]|uniref:Uncharacterized protein n=1 Tax=Chiloscyllium punctatum TaxID=137246 RepID=A0A401SXD1_CHIPU|nr:hypothetical protein [Chiloscyllium punctatum]